MLKNHPCLTHTIVTVGVLCAAYMGVYHPHLNEEATVIAVFSNLIWIWGDMI